VNAIRRPPAETSLPDKVHGPCNISDVISTHMPGTWLTPSPLFYASRRERTRERPTREPAVRTSARICGPDLPEDLGWWRPRRQMAVAVRVTVY
jgi:hypothetical protein